MTANEKWVSMDIVGTGYSSLYVVVRVFQLAYRSSEMVMFKHTALKVCVLTMRTLWRGRVSMKLFHVSIIVVSGTRMRQARYASK